MINHVRIRNIKGFTLIELLVVVAIIGILAAVGTVAYSGYTSAAKKAVIKNNHASINKFILAELTMCLVDLNNKILKISDGTYLDCYDVYGDLNTNTVTRHMVKYVEANYKNVFNENYKVASTGWMHNNPCQPRGTQENNVQEEGTHTLGVSNYDGQSPTFRIDTCFEVMAYGENTQLRNATVLDN